MLKRRNWNVERFLCSTCISGEAALAAVRQRACTAVGRVEATWSLATAVVAYAHEAWLRVGDCWSAAGKQTIRMPMEAKRGRGSRRERRGLWFRCGISNGYDVLHQSQILKDRKKIFRSMDKKKPIELLKS